MLTQLRAKVSQKVAKNQSNHSGNNQGSMVWAKVQNKHPSTAEEWL